MSKKTETNNMQLQNGNSRNTTPIPGIAAPVNQQFNLLTLREIEVLQLAANGFTTAKIAAHIYLSVDTVEGHRKNIIRKMEAANITHAVAEALRKKWIV